jgi:hypothetical protein
MPGAPFTHAGRRASSSEASSCSSEVHGLTTVVVLAELFEVFESPGALTVTVFVIVPFCVGFTTIVTVADPPSAIVPRSQVTVSF